MSTVLTSLLLLQLVSTDPSPLEPLGRLDTKRIPEASGIVKSRQHAGIFWVHNDSGNPPDLFAINDGGRIVRQFRLDIPNLDWEDIAIDDHGHLYLGDIGNNMGVLRVRAIYRIDEPDPTRPADRPIAPSAVTFYALPKDNRFDSESLIYDGGNATLVAKYHDGRGAELFMVSLEPASPLLRPAQIRSIGRLPGFTEPATGADLSGDRELLAVCSTAVTRVYRRDHNASGPWRLQAEVRYRPLPIEGIAWDGADLRLVAEGGGYFGLSEKAWRSRVPSSPRDHPGSRRGDKPEAKR